ncbi:MAG: cell division protein SepF [Clostridia bacterium]|nr:cell division protein SepF [Clostridia bacterium]
MANGNFFKDTFGKARQKLEGFLYREEAATAPTPSMNDETTYGNPPETYQAPAYQQPAYPQQQAQYPQYPQAGYAPQAGYQQPQYPQYQQPAYQQQPTPAAQPVYQQPAAAPAAPHVGITRNRRAERAAAAQQENKVVDFSAYQQTQPEAEAAQQPASALNARIINARGMSDCRSAITLLRNGDTVLIVLENVSDPAEMRRLVDTLSGACYSLTATITKVSRYGVYLLAPQSIAVYADQATNQMNMAPTRSSMRAGQPAYGAPAQAAPQAQRAAYPANAYQQMAAQPAPYAAPQQAFTQRTAAPEETAQSFYARTAPQGGQMPAFSSQPAGYGYAPDEGVAVDQ